MRTAFFLWPCNRKSRLSPLPLSLSSVSAHRTPGRKGLQFRACASLFASPVCASRSGTPGGKSQSNGVGDCLPAKVFRNAGSTAQNRQSMEAKEATPPRLLRSSSWPAPPARELGRKRKCGELCPGRKRVFAPTQGTGRKNKKRLSTARTERKKDRDCSRPFLLSVSRGGAFGRCGCDTTAILPRRTRHAEESI